jgi:3-dehydrosphinganine reductase
MLRQRNHNYFERKVVLITGGSSGIGRACARLLAARGASVVLIARHRPRLDAAVSNVRSAARDTTSHIAGIVADVTQPAAIEQAVETTLGACGRVDMLINSAGTSYPGYAHELPPARFREVMETNYFGTLHAIRAVLPDMLARSSGHITNIGSVAGFIGVFGYTTYSPSKFAVAGLAECLRAELLPRGIRVSLVCPPDVDTPMLYQEDDHKPPETRAISAHAGVMHADDVAWEIAAGMARGRFLILPNRKSRVLFWLSRLVPGGVRYVMDRQIRRAVR